MAFLHNVTNRVWEYISPRKTQQRRDKPFKVPSVPVRPKPITKDYPHSTPQIKVSRWQHHVKTPGSASSVDMTLLPPSPPTSVEPQEFEGDTLLPDSDDVSQEEWDANEATEVVDESQYLDTRKKSDPEKEKLRRENQGRDLREAGWTEDAVFLFQKLGLRGFEPLMPASWVNDFPSLPTDLFTANDNLAFIKPDSDGYFRAQRALEDLFTLGGLVRDAVLTRAPIRTPEFHIRAAIQKYNRWAMKDAGIDRTWNHLSLFDIVVCDQKTPSRVSELNMIVKLAKLQDQWREAFETHNTDDKSESDFVSAPEELPTVYGVIASYTVMAFVTYVAPTEPDGKASLRIVAIFDFGQIGFDVWNSLAIAIFVIHCRNRMKELREFLPAPEIIPKGDPDV
ncbi:hypothetical protein CC80DRAFT_473666 [Byssothecium circinans]|uniref:Uncharacterized protein n=1 Tax=Byssothecium circinans TaxID=147558 RepID=A0A6A5TUT9_9PLEO|nr:hypothetical protein CC80DRAFT_473666 [Byssothecium circinans]